MSLTENCQRYTYINFFKSWFINLTYHVQFVHVSLSGSIRVPGTEVRRRPLPPNVCRIQSWSCRGGSACSSGSCDPAGEDTAHRRYGRMGQSETGIFHHLPYSRIEVKPSGGLYGRPDKKVNCRWYRQINPYFKKKYFGSGSGRIRVFSPIRNTGKK